MLEFGQKILHGKMSKLLENPELNNSMMICSNTSWNKAIEAGMLTDSFPVCNCTAAQVPFTSYDSAIGYDTYIGFGGGTAIDIAKYLAHKYHAKCIAIPSMLSTNVFATDKVAEITLNGKITTNGVLPDEVWIDKDLLALSEKQSLFGFADVFSISTALNDWILASDKGVEPISNEIFQRAVQVLFKAMALVEDYDNPVGQKLNEVYELIQESGYITNDYGSGRPESGSEHILAKEIEKLLPVPHGVSVTCGIAIMSQIQPMSFVQSLIPLRLKKLGMYEAVKRYISKDVLYKAISNVKPRLDRYTIIDYHTNLNKNFFVENANTLIDRSNLYV